jgi:membrane protein
MTPTAPPPQGGVLGLLKAAFRKRSDDKVARLGAALAYYTAFAIAPLILVVVRLAGLVLGEEAARGEVVDELSEVVGPASAAFIADLVAGARGGGGATAAVIGIAIAVFGASTLVVRVEGALNVVWDVPPARTRGVRHFVRSRLVGLAVVLAAGLLLAGVIVASTAAAAVAGALADDAVTAGIAVEVFHPILAFVAAAAAFVMLFKVLPSTTVAWADALVGGIAAAALFTVGSWLLSRYLASGSVGSGFGAAAGLIVFLVFVYYSAQIVLFGAEVGRVYGLRRRLETAASGDDDVPAPAPVSAEPSAERSDRLPASVGAVGAFLLGLFLGAAARRR